MNNIEILENCWLMKTNHVLDEENKKVRQAIENLIQENKELKEKIIKIKDLCNTRPYVAYTAYGDLLYESDEILELLEGE